MSQIVNITIAYEFSIHHSFLFTKFPDGKIDKRMSEMLLFLFFFLSLARMGSSAHDLWRDESILKQGI